MKARLTLTLALLLICTGAARAAEVPPPPPPEDACANETGAAYGLCNAYCEAMDCDGEPEASATACTKVKGKYTQITGHGLPCEAVACPCAASPAWDAVLAGGPTQCVNSIVVLNFYTTTGVATASINEGSTFCAASPIGAPPIFLPTTLEQAAACFDLLFPLCPDAG